MFRTRIPQFAALIGLGIALTAGCGGGGGASITYSAEGSAGSAEVAYTTAEGTETATVELPWTVTFEVGNQFDGELVVSNPTEAGNVTCEYAVTGFRPTSAEGEASATCGGEFSISGSSASGSFYSEFVDREVPADAPRVAEVVIGTADGATTVFGPLDRVLLAVDLRQLTEELTIRVIAEALPVLPGDGRSLNAATLLRRGDEFEGTEHVVTEGLSPPPGGWEEGRYVIELTVELSDRTEQYEPLTEHYELEFTVEIPEVTVESFEQAQGRFTFEYPSDWVLDENTSITTSIVTNDQLAETDYAASQQTLEDLAILTPLSPAIEAQIVVYLELARFTAPGLEDWVDARVADLEGRGFEVSDRTEISMDHGPAVVVTGTTGSVNSELLFTQSADRLYVVEYQAAAAAAGDDLLAATVDGIRASLAFVPENEPPAHRLEEARILSLDLSEGDVLVADLEFKLPADWYVGDTFDEVAQQRFVILASGPDRNDGTDPDELLLFVEFLDSPPPVGAYADFYLANNESNYPNDYELLGRSEMTVADSPAVRATWTGGGALVEEAYLITGRYGIQPSFRFDEERPDTELVDAVLASLRVILAS